jgi:hypothetical protein
LGKLGGMWEINIKIALKETAWNCMNWVLLIQGRHQYFIGVEHALNRN